MWVKVGKTGEIFLGGQMGAMEMADIFLGDPFSCKSPETIHIASTFKTCYMYCKCMYLQNVKRNFYSPSSICQKCFLKTVDKFSDYLDRVHECAGR